MRHNNKTKSLGRKSGHRKALMANLACNLIEHKRINTTLAKGKALRTYVEPLITKSKTDSTHSRRVVFSLLQNKEAVSELFREVGPKVADRPGGYTRIIKTGSRQGDGAEMCMIELVDFNELYGKEEKKKTRRRRGGKNTSTETASTATPATDKTKAEAPAEAADTKAETTVETPEEAPAKAEKPAEAEAEVKKEAAPEAKADDAPEASADDAKGEDKKEDKA
jgi:large subunit ribosomal protein L17